MIGSLLNPWTLELIAPFAGPALMVGVAVWLGRGDDPDEPRPEPEDLVDDDADRLSLIEQCRDREDREVAQLDEIPVPGGRWEPWAS